MAAERIRLPLVRESGQQLRDREMYVHPPAHQPRFYLGPNRSRQRPELCRLAGAT